MASTKLQSVRLALLASSLLVLVVFLGAAASPVGKLHLAQGATLPQSLTGGLNLASEVATSKGLRGSADAATIITGIINFILALVGIVAVLFLIIAGFSYLTSGGDEKKAQKAKQMLTYVIAGLILIALSAVIVNTVLSLVR